MEQSDIKTVEAYKLIAEYKWGNGYRCRNCENEKYINGKSPYSRRCSKCKKDESSTSNTVFHKLRMPVGHALEIVRLCLNDERRFTAPEMQSMLKEMRYEIDLKAISEFRTKVLQYIPAKTEPYYINDVIVFKIFYFKSAHIMMHGKTSTGKYNYYCFQPERSYDIDFYINKYIAAEAKVSLYHLINHNKHGKRLWEIKPKEITNREILDKDYMNVAAKIRAMLKFCFFSTPQGNATFQKYSINLFFYLQQGGNFDNLMKKLTSKFDVKPKKRW